MYEYRKPFYIEPPLLAQERWNRFTKLGEIVLEPQVAQVVPLAIPSLESLFTQFLSEVAKAPTLVDVNIAAGLALEVLGNLGV